jgi:hypothetical protein
MAMKISRRIVELLEARRARLPADVSTMRMQRDINNRVKTP